MFFNFKYHNILGITKNWGLINNSFLLYSEKITLTFDYFKLNLSF